VSLWATYQLIIDTPEFSINKTLLYILGAGLIFMSQYFFFISWDVSPGAGDNLISAVMVVKLSELFSNQNSDNSSLQHTRLLFFCPDAEESGLRGAREYVKQHGDELQSILAYNINMDSIYRLQDLRFLESEINGSIPLDKDIRKKCSNISKSLGYEIPSLKMPFGGGSTDAAEFAKAGIPALSIIGLDTTFTSGEVPYHTSFDTVDRIEPEAVLACMQIAEQFILDADNSIVKS
jgi:Zn-dependent M28 family amino/carboxypeptidase